MKHDSIYRLFLDIANQNASRHAFHTKSDGRWSDVTWAEQARAVHRLSRGLIALGAEHGQRVGILAQTSLQWVQADLGIVSIGAVTVGVYPSNLGPDCAYIVNHADIEILFVEGRLQLDKILAVRADMPALRKLIVFRGESDPANDTLSWDDFLALAEDVPEEQARERGEAIRPDDLASLVYTSGTTGLPKGVMLTHGNILFTTESVSASLNMDGNYTTLAFLPLAHVFARLISYSCLARAVEVWFAESLATVPADLQEVKPHFITSVPRIYEKVYNKVLSSAADAGGIKLRLFNWAIETGLRVSRLRQAGKPIPAFLRWKHGLADRLVLHKIRNAFGGRLVWAVSGAAPLNTTIAEFFHACGVLILEGIGMTENTSFSHVNRFNANRFGTVGQPGPGIEARTAEDGEVLFRGANVMKGYFKDPESTAETIDEQGWLHSGDIGEIDEQGYLKITDRKKDLIITAGGKNVAPQRIERIMRTSRFIAQAVAYGDRRKYITALITLDPEEISAWAKSRGLDSLGPEELAAEPRVRELIAAEIEERNAQLASFETLKRFHILAHDLTIEAGDLTPSLKIKRKVVVGKHQQALDALYDEA